MRRVEVIDYGSHQVFCDPPLLIREWIKHYVTLLLSEEKIEEIKNMKRKEKEIFLKEKLK